MKLEIYRNLPVKEGLYPLFCTRISAGFPSPADDYIENDLAKIDAEICAYYGINSAKAA